MDARQDARAEDGGADLAGGREVVIEEGQDLRAHDEIAILVDAERAVFLGAPERSGVGLGRGGLAARAAFTGAGFGAEGVFAGAVRAGLAERGLSRVPSPPRGGGAPEGQRHHRSEDQRGARSAPAPELSEAIVLEAVGLGPEHRLGVGGEERRQAEELIDLVEVVHVVVVAQHRAEVGAALADETVVVLLVDERGDAERPVTDVEDVGERAGAAPGVVANPVGGGRALAAGGGGEPGRVLGVEGGRARLGERVERPERVLRAGVPAEEAEERAEAAGQRRERKLGEAAALDVVAEEGRELRALVGSADRRDRGDEIRADRGDVARVEPAVAVANEVDLGLAGDGDDVLDLGEQRLAAGLGGVELRDVGDVDLGPARGQRRLDTMK